MDALNTRKCALIGNGKVVQLVLRSTEAEAWWQISYKGRKWWVLGRFMTDADGNPMDK